MQPGDFGRSRIFTKLQNAKPQNAKRTNLRNLNEISDTGSIAGQSQMLFWANQANRPERGRLARPFRPQSGRDARAPMALRFGGTKPPGRIGNLAELPEKKGEVPANASAPAPCP
jgi:hypothetical protein